MDVKNCSITRQVKLFNLGGHHYQQILIYSLTVYSSLLSQVAIYSEKFLRGPLMRYVPQFFGPSVYLYNTLLKFG